MSDKFEIAYKEFHDKTEWVQDDMNSGKIKGMYWGMHRADVIKAEVERLREENDELNECLYEIEQRQMLEDVFHTNLNEDFVKEILYAIDQVGRQDHLVNYDRVFQIKSKLENFINSGKE